MAPKNQYDRSLLLIDNGKQRHNLSSRLRMTGFRVEMVTSGFHALQMLEDADFEIVIIKNHPDDMPSFEVTGLIRTRWDASELPVVFMQDREYQQTIDMHREMGVNVCLLSSVNFADLLKLLASFPKRKKSSAAL